MSDEPKEATEEVKKKKGGKLPIVIALVAVLAGGGFFMMKAKGGKHEPPPLKLGAIEPLKEFLVNLKEGNVYLRTEIALHFKEGFKKEELDKSLPAVEDAIVTLLGARSSTEIRTLDGKAKLKRDLAEAINKVLEAAEKAAHPEEAAEEEPAAKDGEKQTSDKKDPKAGKEAKHDEEPPKDLHPDWDSQTGPVLKLYFTSFATQ
ncbi:MAG: flagellar basal body-associated FliL family protein [Fimbriimonadaceae bacterium]|nr:flagellar basal body-associated FliL family protein [Fimbriimonadaceae bacterium]